MWTLISLKVGLVEFWGSSRPTLGYGPNDLHEMVTSSSSSITATFYFQIRDETEISQDWDKKDTFKNQDSRLDPGVSEDDREVHFMML